MEALSNLGYWGVPAIYVAHLFVYAFTVASVSLALHGYRRLGIGSAIEKRPLRPNQIADEIRWGLLTLLVMSVYFYLSVSAIDRLSPLSAISAIINLLIFIVAHDFYVYITHRALHSKHLWRFHREHHRAVRATPWSSLSMHPVEAMVNYLPFLLFAVFVPVSFYLFLGIYLYLLFGIVYSHSNYNVASASTSTLVNELNIFHQKHHSSKNGNFGLLYTHWDSVFGTKLPD